MVNKTKQDYIDEQLKKDKIAKEQREKRQRDQEEQRIKDQDNKDKVEKENKQFDKPDNKEISIKEKGIRKAISTPLGESKVAIKIRNRIAILEENFLPSESEIYRAGLIALEKMTDDQIRKEIKSLSKKELDWSK